MVGRIHSIETMGTVDGPGMRFVLFLQGCPLRCAYCHNPDTWDPSTYAQEMTVADVWTQFERNRDFYITGGITVTGGEALLQLPFIIELFTFFHGKGIHTCLDTSGICYTQEEAREYKLLLDVTDLVILDVKEIDSSIHETLTGKPNDAVLAFAKFVDEHGTDFWVRHVVVPTITDNRDRWYRLGFFLGAFKHLKAVDCLPYHVMGVNKYESLGISYRLDGVPPLSKADAQRALRVVLSGIRDYRRRLWCPIADAPQS